MIVVSIDPGATGAIAFFENGSLLSVEDMPAIEVMVGKTKRRRVSAGAVASVLFKHGHVAHVYTEKVGPMPTDGSQQAFGLGFSAGILDGVVAALGLPISQFTPQAWKKGMGLDKDKGKCRFRAIQLFPEHAALFARVKDDGRAEAALMGLYAISRVNPHPQEIAA